MERNCKAQGYVEAHHIKSWAKFPALRYQVDNGVTFCKPCHKEANRLQRIQERGVA